MADLAAIEAQIQTALKARDQVAADTLRGLKTRIQNEKIAKGKDLSEDDVAALVASEVKRRKEAATAYQDGGRTDQADKELAEAEILKQFLPPQASDEEISAKLDQLIAENSWTASDFGKAMGKLKAEFGSSADGATLSRILKEKLK